MKYLNVALSLLVASIFIGSPADAVSKHTLDGYRNMRFGEPKAGALRKLGALYGKMKVLDSGAALYVGEVVGYRNVWVYPKFVRDKLAVVRLVFHAQQGQNTMEVFEELEEALKKNYGQPTTDVFNWNAGHTPEGWVDGQAHSYTYEDLVNFALNGKVSFNTRWRFPGDGNVVSLETERYPDDASRLFVALEYYSPSLYSKESDQRAREEL